MRQLGAAEFFVWGRHGATLALGFGLLVCSAASQGAPIPRLVALDVVFNERCEMDRLLVGERAFAFEPPVDHAFVLGRDALSDRHGRVILLESDGALFLFGYDERGRLRKLTNTRVGWIDEYHYDDEARTVRVVRSVDRVVLEEREYRFDSRAALVGVDRLLHDGSRLALASRVDASVTYAELFTRDALRYSPIVLRAALRDLRDEPRTSAAIAAGFCYCPKGADKPCSAAKKRDCTGYTCTTIRGKRVSCKWYDPNGSFSGIVLPGAGVDAPRVPPSSGVLPPILGEK